MVNNKLVFGKHGVLETILDKRHEDDGVFRLKYQI